MSKPSNDDCNVYRILSIDGGGIRGIIPSVWIEHLEKSLGENIKIADYFDLIVGTSTGAILAAALAAGKSASEIRILYEKEGENIFPRENSHIINKIFSFIMNRPVYSDKPLEDCLTRLFKNKAETETETETETEIKFGDLKTKCLITSYDVLGMQPRFFRSWRPELKLIPVWELCKASCSAPVHFPAHIMEIDMGTKVALIDGGIAANNPSILAYAEAIEILKKEKSTEEKSILLVSMGTGDLIKSIPINKAKNMGIRGWINDQLILNVLFDGTSLTNDQVCDSILGDGQYFRFQTTLKCGKEELDNASKININDLKNDALNYIKGRRFDNGKQKMEGLIDKLKEIGRIQERNR